MRALVLTGLLLLVACSSGTDPSVAPATTSPVTTSPVTTSPVTTSQVTTSPVTTSPVTTSPVTTSPVTTSPVTTSPVTTSPVGSERPTIEELLASGEVLNIAHAGGDQEWPHSTFYAYDRAVDAGADVLELDVQLTGDGVLIVQHDDTVDGTTNGTGPVTSFTFDEITELDAAHWYAPGCWPCRDLDDDAYVLRGVRTGDVPAPDGVDPDDLRIVSFAEVVERYPAHPLDIEIKGSAESAVAVADRLAAEIDAFDLTDHVVVVSFDDATIEYFQSIAPDVEVSPGVATMSRWLLEGEALDPVYRIVQVPPMFGEVEVITPAFWDAVADAGVAVWMWPNDAAAQENAAFYREMIDQGVSGIIAGRPSDVP